MLPSAVDWSEFHVWSFLVSDVEKTQHKNALRLGVELNCSSCMVNRLPPKDRKLRVRFKFRLDAIFLSDNCFLWDSMCTEFRSQRVKRCKRNHSFKWVLVKTELFNIAVKYFNAKKKSARYSEVFVETELVESRTQCTWSHIQVGHG